MSVGLTVPVRRPGQFSEFERPPLLSLVINPACERSLVDQIVAGVRLQIDDRRLAPGSKLPSLRDFARTLNVSRFTVVEAYDRLVAMGYLQSRRGAGFYVAALATL